MKTSKKQTSLFGVEKSMYLPEGSPVSLSAALENEKERKTTVTSGRKCFEQYEKYSPLGLLVKMLLESPVWYNQVVRLRWKVKPLCLKRLTRKRYLNKNLSLKPSVETLSTKDIPSSRLLFRLVPSVPHIDGIASGLLPTVQTQGLKICNSEGKRGGQVVEGNRIVRKTGNVFSAKLSDLAKSGLLPTPVASDATTGAIIGQNDLFVTTRNGTPRKINQNGQNGSIGLARIVQMLPTPTASDYKPGYAPGAMVGSDGKPRTDMLRNIPSILGEHCSQRPGKTSQLNPLFVEEMMGFPLMWCVLPFLSENGGKEPLKDTETQ